MFRNKPRR